MIGYASMLDLADPAWTDFVDHHPDATAFHDPRWARLVADTYRFAGRALVALDFSHRVIAGLPLVEVRRGPLPSRWVCLPFTDHCQPLIRVGAPAKVDVIADLITMTRAAAGVGTIIVRGEVPGGSIGAIAVRHVTPLAADPSAVLATFSRSQVQRSIRRAERDGVTVREGHERADLTETFYRLHLLTRARQGTPVQPRRFFHLLWDRVLASGLGNVLVAEHHGAPVAAAVFLRRGHTVIYKYGASDPAAWPVRPNHALFWAAIRCACLSGATAFDWGRTDFDNAGLRAFKTSWAAVEQPLVYTSFGSRTLPAGPGAGAAPLRRAAGRMISSGPRWVCRLSGELLYRWAA